MTDLPDKKYFTPQEVADFFNIKVKTIYGWIAEGKMEAERIGPNNNGPLRIKKEIAKQLSKSTLL